tara:strand:+ start:107 stop:586 length:480 start_codon:yes stop_codon:yes gene_type:complete
MKTRQAVLTKSHQVRQLIHIELEKFQEEFLKYYHIVNQLANLQFIQKQQLQQELIHIETTLQSMIRNAKTVTGEELFVFDSDSYQQEYFLWCCYNFDNASDCKIIKLPKLRLILDSKHPEYLFREPITTYPKYSQEYYLLLLTSYHQLFSKIQHYQTKL